MKKYELISNSQNLSLNVLLVKLFKCGLHLHKEIEVGLLLRGKLKLTVSDSAYRLHAGDMFVLNSMDLHSLEAVDGGVMILALQFPKSMISSIKAVDPPCFSDNVITSAMAAAFPQYDVLRGLLIELAYHYFFQAPHFEYKCTSLLNMIYYLICKALPTRLPEGNKQYRMDRRLARIIDYIEEHYTEKILLSDISEREGLSLTYLSHLFKKNLKISFQEYLAVKRLRYAKELLTDTSKSITDISIESGFSDPRYLNSVCKKYYNCSAAELRSEKNETVAEFAGMKIHRQFFSTREDAIAVLNDLRCEYYQKYGNLSVLELYDS